MSTVKEEWFDVVDASDRVVGRETRAEVHRRKLLHRAVHIFVVDRAGRIYLQQRSLNKDTAPGKWVTSCSGHVDHGEGYLEAAVREIGEELGILLGPEDLRETHAFAACRETGHEFVRIYFLRNFAGDIHPDPGEILSGSWRTREEINAWLEESPKEFSGSFRYLWPRISSQV